MQQNGVSGISGLIIDILQRLPPTSYTNLTWLLRFPAHLTWLACEFTPQSGSRGTRIVLFWSIWCTRNLVLRAPSPLPPLDSALALCEGPRPGNCFSDSLKDTALMSVVLLRGRPSRNQGSSTNNLSMIGFWFVHMKLKVTCVTSFSISGRVLLLRE